MTAKTQPSELLDRLPPQDLQAEANLLGSIMLKPDVFDTIGSRISGGDFYAHANQTLYAHLVSMHVQGEPIDATTLVARLRQSGDLERIGGTAYLAEVAGSVPYAAHAGRYADLICKAAKYRRIIDAATEALRDAYNAQDEPQEILNRTEAALAEIPTQEHDGDPVHIGKATCDAIVAIDEVARRGKHAGLMTGLPDYDAQFGGLFPGEVTVLAARPSVGKTALACQIAHRVAQSGRTVYFASLEMSAAQLATRMTCTLGGVSSRAVRTGRLWESDVVRLTEASNQLAKIDLWIHDRPELTVYDIQRAARRLAKRELSLVIVDYLQLVTPEDKRVNREQQVATISRQLKALSRELDVPVVVLCQLNRAAAQQDRPAMHNLRESGAIEQDADVVIFLWRPDDGDVLEENGQRWTAEMIVAKNRNGNTGRLRLEWCKQRTLFRCPGSADRESD